MLHQGVLHDIYLVAHRAGGKSVMHGQGEIRLKDVPLRTQLLQSGRDRPMLPGSDRAYRPTPKPVLF
jgi:hypothetical protein